MSDVVAAPNGLAGTVLLVDDDASKRYVVGRMLRAAGHRVTEAEDGVSALRLAEANPDLIVLDIRLPDIDGHELSRRLKADARTSTIMILQLSSTFATGSDKIVGLASGADAYLTHPVETQELLATVAALMRIRRAEQERTELLQRAQAARLEANRANRLKDDFLATISHELRTPLHAMLGWVRLLRGGKLDEAGREHALEIIERNARMQAQLIEDLLDMSRILTGKMTLEAQPVNLGAVVALAIEAVRLAADTKGIQIELQVDRDEQPIVGDPTRLQQVFWNLLSNAIKFTARGGHIEARVEKAGAEMVVRIRDDGQGITPEFLAHVFERFRQAESSSRRSQGGIGLGLAIVRQLVESHGGTVEAQSAGVGQGATFIVRLPREGSPNATVAPPEADAGAPAPAPRPAPAPPPVPAPSGGERSPQPRAASKRRQGTSEPPAAPSIAGTRVLVVDDEADARDYLATVLQQSGAEVKVAGNVDAALTLFERWTPDVVLCDISMPDRDGYDFIRALRGLRGSASRTPAAAITAYAKPEDRRRAMMAGYQDHMSKPIEPGAAVALVATLRRAR